MWRIEQPPLFLLHRILLHLPSHRKLATVLQDNPLPQLPRFAANKSLKDEISGLIKSYIKVIEPSSFLQRGANIIDLMPYLTCQSDGQSGVQIFTNIKQHCYCDFEELVDSHGIFLQVLLEGAVHEVVIDIYW